MTILDQAFLRLYGRQPAQQDCPTTSGELWRLADRLDSIQHEAQSTSASSARRATYGSPSVATHFGRGSGSQQSERLSIISGVSQTASGSARPSPPTYLSQQPHAEQPSRRANSTRVYAGVVGNPYLTERHPRSPARGAEPSGDNVSQAKIDLSETLRTLAQRQNELRIKSRRPEATGRQIQQHNRDQFFAQAPATGPRDQYANEQYVSLTNPPPAPEPMHGFAGPCMESFHWPELCNQIAASYQSTFEPVVNILLECAQQGRRLVGVTSCYESQGCTTMVLTIARVLVELGRTVAIVEGNFGSPSLAGQLEVQSSAWWQDVLIRGLSPSEALTLSQSEPVAILPLNPQDNCSWEITQSEAVLATVRELANQYEFVLVDLGAMLVPTQQPAALQLVAAMGLEVGLIISDNSVSMPGDPELTGQLLGESGCEVLGVVETQVRSQAA